MPPTEGVVGQRGGVGRIDVDHHFGDITRLGFRAVGGQSKLPTQGRLYTGPVQNLALNGARPHRLFAYQLDAKPIALLAGHMADGAEDLSLRTAGNAAPRGSTAALS